MHTADLPTSTPSAEGVSAGGVLAFLDDVHDAEGVELHGLVVLRHGRRVAAGWWHPYTPDRPHHLYSLSKTFTATAAGLAVEEGLLDLDEPVVSYLPELAAEVRHPRTLAMRVRHLLSMSTGHTQDMWEPVVRLGAADPVRTFLSLPPEREPGSVFAYNQPATYTLAAILQRRTGQTLLEWLRPRVLDPIGVGPVSWQEHPPGRQLGFSGLHATTDDVARLGQLYLQRGRWGDRQLLPRGWVEEATAVHVATPDEDEVDWRQGYGYQVWRSRHGYRGDGAYGQLCLVLPDHDAVVAVTGQSPDLQRVLDAVWTHLLPALEGRGGTSAEDDARLAARLADLALPAPPGRPAPAAEPDRWDGRRLSPTPATRRAQPSLTGATVRRTPDGWAVVLQEGRDETTVRVGPQAWTTTDGAVPVAAGGGWRDDGTLGLEVAFLESPHRLLLTGDPHDDTVAARWLTEPLGGGPLRGLRAPR